MGRKLLAEFLGTFWLTFGGCGSVVLWGLQHNAVPAGPEVTSIALAFGLTVVTMAYAIGHISGCHLNPAVTIGLVVAKRFDAKDAGPYIGAQVVGGIVAAFMLWLMVNNLNGAADVTSVGANNYKPDGLLGALLSEFILTFFFLIVILGVTSKKASPGMAGLAIGLCLALIHMIGIGVTGVSVNPARSIGPALFSSGNEHEALKHLWLFIVVPPIGAAVAAIVHNYLEPDSK